VKTVSKDRKCEGGWGILTEHKERKESRFVGGRRKHIYLRFEASLGIYGHC
jgi:hypothetical protein